MSEVRSPRRCLALSFLGCVLAPLAAQSAIVVPSRATAAEPGTTRNDAAPQDHVFWGTARDYVHARQQSLYDVQDIALSAAMFRSIALRPPVGATLPATTVDLDVRLGTTLDSTSQLRSRFEWNARFGLSTVHSGPVNLPAVRPSTVWPAPWIPALPFAAPFAYARSSGASLLVEFRVRSNSARTPWIVEGYHADWGRADLEHSRPDCVNVAGFPSTVVEGQIPGLYPGGYFTAGYGRYPQQMPSLATNALLFGATGVGSQLGGFTTPFALRRLGIPAAPECELAIAPLLGTPMTYRPGSIISGLYGSLSLTFVLPNDPGLAGVSFYTQSVALQTEPSGANTWFPSAAQRWEIGTGATIPCSSVKTRWDPAFPADGIYGGVELSEAPAIRLGY